MWMKDRKNKLSSNSQQVAHELFPNSKSNHIGGQNISLTDQCKRCTAVADCHFR